MTRQVWIGLDDACPALDPKGPPHFRVLDEFLASFPAAKITHFVPAEYSMRHGLAWGIEKQVRRTMGWKTGLRAIPAAALDRHAEWVAEFAGRKSFRAELHGLYHVDFKTGDAQEFRTLDETESRERIDRALDIFASAKLPVPRVLSPPGWAAPEPLRRVLAEKRIALAGSLFGSDNAFRAGIPGTNAVRVTVVDGVACIPRNLSIESFDPARVDALAEQNGLIGIHGHYKNIGVKNGLSLENLSNLFRIVERVEKAGPVEFLFAHEGIDRARA